MRVLQVSHTFERAACLPAVYHHAAFIDEVSRRGGLGARTVLSEVIETDGAYVRAARVILARRLASRLGSGGVFEAAETTRIFPNGRAAFELRAGTGPSLRVQGHVSLVATGERVVRNVRAELTVSGLGRLAGAAAEGALVLALQRQYGQVAGVIQEMLDDGTCAQWDSVGRPH